MTDMIIKHEGTIYIFNNSIESEPYNLFLKRCWYIVNKKPKNNKDFEYYNKLSIIWRNIKFLGIEYNEFLESII